MARSRPSTIEESPGSLNGTSAAEARRSGIEAAPGQ
jgi:hypothetical protein